jgi:hypothetical protein
MSRNFHATGAVVAPWACIMHSLREVGLPQHFFFDLTNGPSTIRDEKGVWVSDLAGAIDDAQAVIEEMRDSDELSGDEEGWLLIIRNKAGDALMTLPIIPRVPVTVS